MYIVQCMCYQLYAQCISHESHMITIFFSGESIPIRLFLAGYELTPSMKDINKKFSCRYYLNLVLVDEEDRRYFKQQVRLVIFNSPKRSVVFTCTIYVIKCHHTVTVITLVLLSV